MDEPCRLRRGEGYGACEDESASFADFFLARQKKVSRRRHGCGGAATGEKAVTGASLPTMVNPPEARLRCATHRGKNGDKSKERQMPLFFCCPKRGNFTPLGRLG